MENLEKLRRLVRDCISKHMATSAVFFADKLVSLSGGCPQDVFLLVQAYMYGRQHRRALHLIRAWSAERAQPLAPGDELALRYLAAKCLVECGQWEECLSLLDGVEVPAPDQGGPSAQGPKGGVRGTPAPSIWVEAETALPGEALNLRAALCYLRGQAYDALSNRAKATHWFKAAVKADPFCYQAVEKLLEHQLLTAEQEQQLFESLDRSSPMAEWLVSLYTCKRKKYNQLDTFEATVRSLETGQAGTGGSATRGDEPVGGVPSGRLDRGGAEAGPQTLGSTRAARVGRGLSAEFGDVGGAAGEAAAADAGGETSPRGLGRLDGNGDVMSWRADYEFHKGDFLACVTLTERLLERDPYHLSCLPIHLAACVELKRSNDLYLRAHQLVEEYPERAISWYAVGCYYTSIGHYDSARRYYSKATGLDASFAAAWIGFGLSFSAQDETDQALVAFRTAARLFPGCHLAPLYIGMEYQKTSNLNLAEQYLLQALAMCPSDPLALNELGVLAYRNKQYEAASDWFRRALMLAPQPLASTSWVPTLMNLGHALRKLGAYDGALAYYDRALALCPSPAVKGGAFSAMGFAYHLQVGGARPSVWQQHDTARHAAA
eukprot:jgi/Mesvir1/12381/Mv00559-RA.3